MPEPFGKVTKTKILKSEMGKLHQEFSVDDLKATITFGSDLVTANVVNGAVNGVAIAPVTFVDTHANMMAAIVAALLLLPNVASASVTSARVITVLALDPEAPFLLAGWVTTAGAGQATITTATDTNNIYQSASVKLTSDGKVEPAGAAESPLNVIGMSIHNGVGGNLVTVMMKAAAIIWAEAGTASLVAGPVKLHTTPYNVITGYVSVDDASVTASNIYGWALDSAASAGDLVRVAIL